MSDKFNDDYDPKGTLHDERYSLLSHNHDDAYYTKHQIDELLSSISIQFPSYSTSNTRTINDSHTETTDGYLVVLGTCSDYREVASWLSVNVDGVTVFKQGMANNDINGGGYVSGIIPIKKDSTYSITCGGSRMTCVAYWCPIAD